MALSRMINPVIPRQPEQFDKSLSPSAKPLPITSKRYRQSQLASECPPVNQPRRLRLTGRELPANLHKQLISQPVSHFGNHTPTGRHYRRRNLA